MVKDRRISDEVKKIKILQEAWLQYYNNYLFEKGYISQSEYNKIAVKIRNRIPAPVS